MLGSLLGKVFNVALTGFVFSIASSLGKKAFDAVEKKLETPEKTEDPKVTESQVVEVPLPGGAEL